MNKEIANKAFVLQTNLTRVEGELRKVKSALDCMAAENKKSKLIVISPNTDDYEFWINDDRIKNILLEEKGKHEKLIEKINSEIEAL